MTARAALLVLLALPAPAAAQTATVPDPAGDGAAADVTEVRVARSAPDQVTVTLTFVPPVGVGRFDLLVSPAAKDETKPSVLECDAEREGFFTVRSLDDLGDRAVLRLGRRGARIEATGVRDGATVTYVFTSSVFPGAFSGINPFVCVSGDASSDAFYGPFDGATLKLNIDIAHTVVRERVGEEASVRCPRAALSPSGDGSGGSAFCAFATPGARRYRMGVANVVLEGGKPRILFIQSRTFPNALKYCGANGGQGWQRPPLLGAGIEAWGQNVSCRTARRFALTLNGRTRHRGFRCRQTRRAYEAFAFRCTASGNRVIRVEGGS